MKKKLRLLPLLLLAALFSACGAGVSEDGSAVELFAVNVGKGDALIVRVDNWTGLIDTGKAAAGPQIRAALRALGVTALDAVFITHTDKDHTGGLDWLAESDLPVGAWYASALYTGVKAGKHPAAKAASRRDQSVVWLRRGDTVPLGDTGASFEVLAPYALFEDKDDNNSLVMLLETDQGRMLFAGDMELPEEAGLLNYGDDLSCAVLKVANHGDGDTTSEALAHACRAQAAIISTDGQEKPGTPDPGVLVRLQAAGTACYVTENAGLGLRVTLANGRAAVEAAPLESTQTGVYISEVVPGADLIALANAGADCDLSGFTLYSERGNEQFVFPEGFVLPAGGTVTVGTRSSDGDYDLLWDDKKVIHKSKSDTIFLYDRSGTPVDRRDNGL